MKNKLITIKKGEQEFETDMRRFDIFYRPAGFEIVEKREAEAEVEQKVETAAGKKAAAKKGE